MTSYHEYKISGQVASSRQVKFKVMVPDHYTKTETDRLIEAAALNEVLTERDDPDDWYFVQASLSRSDGPIQGADDDD